MSTTPALPAAVNPLSLHPWNEGGCPERDKMILAFLLAMNEGFNASSELEKAVDDAERTQYQKTIENAKGYSHALRSQVIVHCLQHGC